MSLLMQKLYTYVEPGHAVCLALIRVSGEHYVIVGVDPMDDENEIREVARASARPATIIVHGGDA